MLSSAAAWPPFVAELLAQLQRPIEGGEGLEGTALLVLQFQAALVVDDGVGMARLTVVLDADIAEGCRLCRLVAECQVESVGTLDGRDRAW